jgi:hypothetical protein
MIDFDIANLVVGVITVALSVVGSWVVVKEDLAQLKQRLINVEHTTERNTEVSEKLTEVLSDLRVAIAELRVEMKHVKDSR